MPAIAAARASPSAAAARARPRRPEGQPDARHRAVRRRERRGAPAAARRRAAADSRRPARTGARGTTSTRRPPQFAAGAQHTLYSGVELGDHGLFYPFQWSATEQRVRYMGDFDAPPPIWERLGRHGTRTLAIDPYESRPPVEPPPGTLVCGWQLHDRVVLQQLVVTRRPTSASGASSATPEPVDEVFGRHTVSEMLALRRRLLGAPGRVADAATLYLREAAVRPGVADVLRRPRRRPPVLGPLPARPDRPRRQPRRACSARTLDDVYVAVDAALGRIVAALPAGTDVLVVSPVGMDVNTSRADMLPEMLQAILDPAAAEATAAGELASGGCGPRSRATCARKVARVLPERVALDLTARLELRGVDWSRTRAFAHPAENQGYVRLNLRGPRARRHRRPRGRRALLDEIADGAAHVHRPRRRRRPWHRWSASPTVRQRRRADLLPDLIVRWTDRPATDLEGVTSERFGTVRRHGVGSGRSGNHTEGDAWALVVPGAVTPVTPTRPPRLEDIAATAAALAGSTRRPGRRTVARGAPAGDRSRRRVGAGRRRERRRRWPPGPRGPARRRGRPCANPRRTSPA